MLTRIDNNVLGGGGATPSKVDAILPVTRGYTGFDPVLNSSMSGSYSSADRKVTLTNVAPLYLQGVRFPMAEGWVSPAHPDVTGTYFLRLDVATKQIIFNTTPWEWYDGMIAYVQYDAVTKIGRALREFHGVEMPWTDHEHFHDVIGTLRVAGGGMTGVTLNSTTPANRRPDVAACTVRDEDVESVIPTLSSKLYTQRFLAGAGASRSFVFGASDIVKLSGNRPYWNQFTGGAWQDTLFNNNEYGALFLVAIPAMSDADSQAIRYMWVQPQLVSTTLSTVQALTPSSLTHGDSSTLVSEFVFIGKVIIRYQGTNWTVISTELLSGSRYLQVGSPSGSYLSAVSTDESLTGNGTPANPLSIKPLTGQTAPTTSTAGYNGQVIYDTSGNVYRCDAISGSVYTWTQIYPEPSGVYALSADQTTGNGGGALAAGDRLKLVARGYTPFTVNADGSIVLPAGTYDFELTIKGLGSGSTFTLAGGISESGGSVLSNAIFVCYAMSSSSAASAQPHVMDRITLAAETTIEVQLGTVTATTNITRSGTMLKIKRVK